MRPFVPHKAGNGFTLLEVLISITLFSLVISSVYGAYRVTFLTVHTTERQALLGAAARVILERITADLEAVATDRDSSLLGKRGDVAGFRADGLSFVATAHVAFTRAERSGGRAQVVYTAEENDDGLIDLYRLDTPDRPAAGQEGEPERGELLGRNLREFRLTYVAEDGSEVEEWRSGGGEGEAVAEEQTPDMLLPVLVRVEIRLAAASDDEAGTLFRTAVALPSRPAEKTEG